MRWVPIVAAGSQAGRALLHLLVTAGLLDALQACRCSSTVHATLSRVEHHPHAAVAVGLARLILA